MLAILLALFGSFWFAVSMVLIHRGVLSVDYFRGLLANLSVNALFLWIYVFLFTARIDLWAPANLLFVLVGLFVPGVARYFIFKGMERLGASISSCLTNSSPLFATIIAIALLRERPSMTNLLGTLSIVSGIASLSWRGSNNSWRNQDLLLPLAAAFLFAARDNVVRVGVVQIHSPILGAAIAASTSFATMLLMYLIFEKKKPLDASAARGLKLFSTAGFMNFLSYAFIFSALSMEQVSIISPLVNSSSLFVLPFSALFLKDVEQLTRKKIGAVLLVILGVLLISWEKF
jgi:drug/metabolite transporter, DME family